MRPPADAGAMAEPGLHDRTRAGRSEVGHGLVRPRAASADFTNSWRSATDDPVPRPEVAASQIGRQTNAHRIRELAEAGFSGAAP